MNGACVCLLDRRAIVDGRSFLSRPKAPGHRDQPARFQARRQHWRSSCRLTCKRRALLERRPRLPPRIAFATVCTARLRFIGGVRGITRYGWHPDLVHQVWMLKLFFDLSFSPIAKGRWTFGFKSLGSLNVSDICPKTHVIALSAQKWHYWKQSSGQRSYRILTDVAHSRGSLALAFSISRVTSIRNRKLSVVAFAKFFLNSAA